MNSNFVKLASFVSLLLVLIAFGDLADWQVDQVTNNAVGNLYEHKGSFGKLYFSEGSYNWSNPVIKVFSDNLTTVLVENPDGYSFSVCDDKLAYRAYSDTIGVLDSNGINQYYYSSYTASNCFVTQYGVTWLGRREYNDPKKVIVKYFDDNYCVHSVGEVSSAELTAAWKYKTYWNGGAYGNSIYVKAVDAGVQEIISGGTRDNYLFANGKIAWKGTTATNINEIVVYDCDLETTNRITYGSEYQKIAISEDGNSVAWIEKNGEAYIVKACLNGNIYQIANENAVISEISLSNDLVAWTQEINGIDQVFGSDLISVTKLSNNSYDCVDLSVTLDKIFWKSKDIFGYYQLYQAMRKNDISPKNCEEVKLLRYSINGDFNGDCKVNLTDLASFANNWMKTIDPNDLNSDKPWLD